MFGCLDNTQTNFEGTSEGMVVKRTKYDKNKPSIYQGHLSQTNLIRKEKKKKKSKQSPPWAFLDKGNALDLICLDFSNTSDKRATWEIIVCVGRSRDWYLS